MNEERILPRFIIVGCMKSGTSTLSHLLREHSAVYIPSGEIFYFSSNRLYQRGLDWYSRIFSKASKNPTLLIGEKSNSYSYNPLAAERIHSAIPDVKLIWVFRNPVDRTYSNYLHQRAQGMEFHSFRSALALEKRRIRRNIFMGYQERSKYHLQVRHFLKIFPPEQMHYLLFEDLIRDPQEEMNRLCNFLNIPHENIKTQGRHDNPSPAMRFVWLLWLARRLFGRRTLAWHALQRFCTRKPGTKNPPMPADLRTRLKAAFVPHNEELARLTGLDLSVWNR